MNVYLVSTGVDDVNIHGALKEINKFVISHNVFKYGALGCYGNGVMGGKSKYLDRNGNETSVPKSLRTSIMGITCYAILDETGIV